MFTRAAPLIANNLWQGGMSQAQSSSVAGALGQCNAPLGHRAPVTIDYTSPDMKQITIEGATYNYPTFTMNPPEAFPPRPPKPRPPEELPPWEPEPFEPGPPIDGPPGYYPEWPGTGAGSGGGGYGGGGSGGGGYGGGGYGGGGYGGSGKLFTRAGKYLRAPRPSTVELAYASDNEGNVCTFKGGKIAGVDYGELQEAIENWNNNNPGEGNNRSITVVTDVQLTGSGLVISKLEGVQVIYGGGEASHDIPVIDCGNP